ncbi:ATP-binding protein [Pseudoduganella lutea]|uniref:histidine kinase n=1 Tax=Pseudoduganella lutea TaxID=321985 RepID=A0A4V0Z352_9BURK|nr:ATP-binding protein [Pseudoduganella lutea]QBE62233.1 response regulator [Pseudoduganella lutea]
MTPDTALPLIPDRSPHGRDASFLDGGSDMAMLIRSLDWSRSPLGPIEGWPQSLRTTVSLCLASNFPINIIWGPDNVQIYNDGYRIVCGEKHPASLGMDYKECWASAWPAIGEPFEQARKGETSFLENVRMFLFRNGYLEETFFTFSLSPIRDETGGIGGLFHPVTETTATMVSERRTRAVRDLTARLTQAITTDEVFQLTIDTLAGFEFDLPFVLLYEPDPASTGKPEPSYRLHGHHGIDAGASLAPQVLSLAQPGGWPVAELMHGMTAIQVPQLRSRIGTQRCGPYDEPPDVAFAIPIRRHGADAPVALLMAGASSRLPLDDVYRGFFDLLGAAFAAALTRVTAYEEERKRAELLAAIDRAKTVFFSNVSHEFRTPLTLMLGPLEDALAGADGSDELRERLVLAHRNALRLLKLVNSLLDFSRTEAGRAAARFVPTDAAALTAELASNFRSACMQAGLSLDVDCPPQRESAWIDRDMWEKIVLNLLSNAFKFTLQGGIRVTLRSGDKGLELTVADTGVGIPADDVPRIFERFHRVEGQHGRSAEGTGIGLALARELVLLHGGTINVDSQQGRGTTFTVRIPFGRAHLPPDQVGSEARESDMPALANTYVEEALRWLPERAGTGDAGSADAVPDRPRVVLADDNADMREYVTRVLREGGYQVHAVGNGAAALAAIRGGPLPELVLSDVMMPDMDGFALLAALRADPATAGVVMVLLSARAGTEARAEGLAAGADDYMVKPFSARELRARVDGAVALGRQRREAARREQALHVQMEAERGRMALRDSEAHLTSLYEQTAAGVAEANANGVLVRVNDRYCEIVGRPREELLGKHFNRLVDPEDRAENERRMMAGSPFELENRYLRPDGSTIWVTKAVTPIRDETGAVASVLAVVLDVTPRKAAEAELRAESRRKDEFLAMLAHELRNPLAPISAAAALIGQAYLDEARLKQTSHVISRQVRHMTGLIDDLLDVSRVTRGLVTLETSLQDVKTVVANAVEQVRPLIESHRHHLTIDLDPSPACVMGDAKRLVQILTNLLNNAAKYTPAGGRIALRTRVDDGHVLVEVEDNGIGIAPELLPRVFELFAQAERTPDRAQGGLGLGLALVRSLAELHGGSVHGASSGAGQGSTFTVCLPRAAERRDQEEREQIQAMPAARSGLSVMVVDDNVDAAEMLALLLEASGYRVAAVHDPLVALERSRTLRPDVCLLDIGLPGMDGNELLAG